MNEAGSFPDFAIVGVQKGGTTSLFRYLLQHPQVIPPSGKEPHFFDLEFERGPAWYARHFAAATEARAADDRRCVTGEASPYYFRHPLAAQRMASICPGIRILVLLRDPVARAVSHYHHEVRLGYEKFPMEEAFAREPERLAGEADKLRDQPGYQSWPYQHYGYLTRGLYAEQLACWRSAFPAEQILVLNSEAFFRDPAPSLARSVAFLGLPQHAFGDLRSHNTGDYPEASDRAQRELQASFEKPNRQLWQELQQHFPEAWSCEFAGSIWS